MWKFPQFLPTDKSTRMSVGHHYLSQWNLSSIQVWTEWSRANIILSTDGNLWPYKKSRGTDCVICFRGGTPTQKWRGCSSFVDSSLTLGVLDGKWLNMLIQVSLRAVHELKFAKKAVTLTSQKSPLRVSLSLSHTHFGLPQGFDVNVNFPTNIPFTFIWKSSRYLPTTSAYKLGRFWRPPCSLYRGPRKE